jgi:NAD(P)-dependent dehydrogenase (short-subunit alcohol dehydrogenase family)
VIGVTDEYSKKLTYQLITKKLFVVINRFPKKMQKSLQDKIILVTGGSGLLGGAMLTDIRLKGGTAINLDMKLETNLGQNQVACDVTSLESIKKSIKIVMDHYGRLNGLVNNAYPRTKDWGIPFEDIEAASLQNNVDWQMNSSILFCREVIKEMKPRQGGSIVNIASIYGVVGNDFSIYEGTGMEPPVAYSAIKGGLISFTRFLASKYGREEIRANCVSPGGIFDHQPEPFVKAYKSKVPMKRMGNPEDIAPAVSFLLSEEAKYITGQNLVVDGGWTAI